MTGMDDLIPFARVLPAAVVAAAAAVTYRLAYRQSAQRRRTVTPWDEAALDAIRLGWDEAYVIEASDGEWRAMRRDGLGGWLKAIDPEGLSRAIRADYDLKPVPRDIGTAPAAAALA